MQMDFLKYHQATLRMQKKGIQRLHERKEKSIRLTLLCAYVLLQDHARQRKHIKRIYISQ